jgi:hypothetical protein
LGKSNCRYIKGADILNNQNYANNQNVIPFITGINGDGAPVKLNEDQYEVYVNGEFVGHKTLKTQGEKISDVDDFLKAQGVTDFSSSLDGDHYHIQTNDESGTVTDALSVYFNNR